MKSSRDNTCIHTKVQAQTPQCWLRENIDVEHETSVRTPRSSTPPLDRHAARPLDRSSVHLDRPLRRSTATPLDRSTARPHPAPRYKQRRTSRHKRRRDWTSTWFGDEDEGSREEAVDGDGVAERDEARRRDETNETPGGGYVSGFIMKSSRDNTCIG